MEFVYSEKNKKLIVLEVYKFGFKKKLVDDIDRWTCIQKTCKSYLKMNNLNIIVDKSKVLYIIMKKTLIKNLTDRN